MNGSRTLSEGERREMLEDAWDTGRREAFRAARNLTQDLTVEAYLEFLSQNAGLVPFRPRRNVTDDFRL
jgi:hypothetical protein